MKIKSEFAKNRSISFLFPLALAIALQAATAKAATLNVVVAGYFGNNSLSSGAILTAGSTVDFGVFYSGSSFTSSSAIASALSTITTDSAMQSFRSANGWSSFGTVTVPTGGDFSMLWDLNSPTDGPGFGTEFNLNPTTGALNGIDLVGKIPYVWIQTAGASTEYGVFVSNQAFVSAGFGAITQVDLSDTGDPASGVTALFGLVNADGSGITTQAVPEPVTAHLALAGIGFLALLRKRFTTVKS